MNTEQADAIIILGRVDQYGSLTIDAHERIRLTAQLFHDKAAPLIVTHAKWSYKLNYTPPCTEAAVVKARLVEWGVPSDKIICEEESCDTLGAAYFLKVRFVEKLNWTKIIVVTSTDHLQRTKYIYDKVFGNSIKINYLCGKKVLSDDAYIASTERELKSLLLMDSTWFKSVIPGDHHAIKNILKLRPGYNPKAKMTPIDIEKRVQNQNTTN